MEVLLSNHQYILKYLQESDNKVLSDLNELINRWKICCYITDICHKSLNSSMAILSRAYSVLKTYKKDNPLRIIISSIDTPVYNLAAYIHNII